MPSTDCFLRTTVCSNAVSAICPCEPVKRSPRPNHLFWRNGACGSWTPRHWRVCLRISRDSEDPPRRDRCYPNVESGIFVLRFWAGNSPFSKKRRKVFLTERLVSKQEWEAGPRVSCTTPGKSLMGAKNTDQHRIYAKFRTN